jgi:hypothetical protein
MTPDAASVAERAASGEVTQDDQQGLFDVVLENELLEAALERRQKAKDKLKPANKAYKEADDAAKGMISGLEEFGWVDPEGDEPLTIRVGRYRVRVAPVKSKSVSFTTEPARRTTISLLDKE